MLRVEDLLLSQNSTTVVVNLAIGEGHYQIGSSLLQDYMVGINYKEGTLSYGLKGDEPAIDIYRMFWWIIGTNILIFLAALVVLLLKPGLENGTVAKSEPEGHKRPLPDKVNEYELASGSEDSSRI